MKEFLSQQGVPYTERDIAADPQAMQELVGLRYMSTPVILVDEEVVVGFDRPKLEALLHD